MEHLTKDDVEGFIDDTLAAADRRRVMQHLLTGCRECCATFALALPQDLFLPQAPRVEEDAYDAVIDRAWEEARRRTKRLKNDQERFERGLALIREHDFHGISQAERQSILAWTHIEIQLQLAFEARYRNLGDMLERAERAVYVAKRLDKTPYGPGYVTELQTRAWAEYANALRVNELFDAAEAALYEARVLLERGTSDPLLHPRVDTIEACLRKDQRRFKEACELHDEAYVAYLKIGDHHLAGRARVSKGIALWLSGNAPAAAKTLQEGIALLDIQRDPKLWATAQHDLLTAYVDLGQLGQAGQILLKTNLRKVFADDPQSLLRLRWVDGRILVKRKRFADAESVFRDVRAGFREQRLEYAAAIAGVDQTEMLLRLGKKKDAYLLAYDLCVTFRRYETEPEAAKALTLLETICRMKVGTAEMAERIRWFLEQRLHDRSLRFDGRFLLLG
ncbi:MAG TPA: hypothetical protein VJ885_01375 [Thermoanaerobaculia bacterium]|nr:hypothetical protein [Thermoanaerobaculia bacterium]